MADESWLRKAARGILDKVSPTPPLYGEMVPPSKSFPDAPRVIFHNVQSSKEWDEAAERRWKEEYEEWRSRNMALLQKFLEIADRKVSRLDEYGDENWDALPHEINLFLLKMVKTMNDGPVVEARIRDALKKRDDSILLGKYRWIKSRLETEFRTFHQNRAAQTNATEFVSLSGTDFEVYLARLLKQNGFEDIQGTVATGDQGADLIAKKNDKKIVIQAKRYQGSVGNKAVQEVVAAVNFYRADEGWVITSGTFTPSAKSLAQANNVKLIDGYALRKGHFD